VRSSLFSVSWSGIRRTVGNCATTILFLRNERSPQTAEIAGVGMRRLLRRARDSSRLAEQNRVVSI
jgi:hypothetical protein